MRLIDADELIEKIEEWQSELTRKDAEESAIDDALEWVNDRIAEADALEWAPVSEGLPNDYDTVLVTKIIYGGEKDIDLAFYGRNAFTGFKEENGEKLTVTAWMRLPEPWEGEKE